MLQSVLLATNWVRCYRISDIEQYSFQIPSTCELENLWAIYIVNNNQSDSWWSELLHNKI